MTLLLVGHARAQLARATDACPLTVAATGRDAVAADRRPINHRRPTDHATTHERGVGRGCQLGALYLRSVVLRGIDAFVTRLTSTGILSSSTFHESLLAVDAALNL